MVRWLRPRLDTDGTVPTSAANAVGILLQVCIKSIVMTGLDLCLSCMLSTGKCLWWSRGSKQYLYYNQGTPVCMRTQNTSWYSCTY